MKRFLLLLISFTVFLITPLLEAAKATEQSGHRITPQEILILNSYHPGYAWSDEEQAGIIDVFRGKDKIRSTLITLTVSDNGVGLPPHIDIKDAESIGLSLLGQLVEQINGSMELIRDNGTQFIITFTVDQEKI